MALRLMAKAAAGREQLVEQVERAAADLQHRRGRPLRRQPQRQLLPGLRGGASGGRRKALGPSRGWSCH